MVAALWCRLETAIHRFDIEDAISAAPTSLPAARTVDAIAETLEFALPLAARAVGRPSGQLTVVAPDLGLRVEIGTGAPQATVTGDGDDLPAALWGRRRDRVLVDGDRDIADQWQALIETAFAER